MQKSRILALSLLSLLLPTLLSVRGVEGQTFAQVSSLTLNSGEANPGASVIDPIAGFAYFVTDPGIRPGYSPIVVKIRLSDFTRVGALTLNTPSYSTSVTAAVIDPSAGFAYFAVQDVNGFIVRVRLSDFTQDATLVVDPNSNRYNFCSAAIDTVAGFAYFGTCTSTTGDVIVKIDLTSFSVSTVMSLNQGEWDVTQAMIDHTSGFAYFGAISQTKATSIVVKVRLSDFTRTATLLLDDQHYLDTSALDPLNGFLYFGTSHQDIIRARLSNFTLAGAMSIPFCAPCSIAVVTTVLDPLGGFGYFGIANSTVVKVNLRSFTETDHLTLGSGSETHFGEAAIDQVAGFAYFGVGEACFCLDPGIIVKVNVSVPPAADFSLSNSGGISVDQGGSGSNTITALQTYGQPSPTTLSCVASTLPAYASCSFETNPVTPTGSSKLTVQTAPATPTGSYEVQVSGDPKGATTIPTTFTLIVIAPPPIPDFSVNAAPSSITVEQGSSGTSVISILSINGFDNQVEISTINLPTGITISLSNTDLNSGQSSTLSIYVSDSVATGSYSLSITGTSQTSTRTAALTVLVTNGHPVQPTSPSPNTSKILGLEPALFYGMIAAVATIILILASAVVVRRRRP